MVNGELPLLQAQGIPTLDSNLVIQVRCPAGLSVLTADDAYELIQNIKRELVKYNHESKHLREFKRDLDQVLENTTDEELKAFFSNYD